MTQRIQQEPRRLIIITGLAGAGRSTAAHGLEDLGWYVVDNLPPSVAGPALEEIYRSGVSKVALVIDVRSGSLFERLDEAREQLDRSALRYEILFLEASDEVIVRRQESARRPHPLQGAGRLLDGIAAERRALSAIRATADLVIDTSRLSPHQLVARLAHAFGGEAADLRALVMSFGFKNGIPVDADLVADVRFLPNPHWDPELRPQTGLDAAVRDFVLAQEPAERFLEQLLGLVEIQRPGYLVEGKRFITVAIGCTGGKHRSTAMAEAFAERLRGVGLAAGTVHRDVGLE